MERLLKSMDKYLSEAKKERSKRIRNADTRKAVKELDKAF